MLKNYFKTAWRNIKRSPGYSGLNVLGLATGMAVALMIGLWVQEQYSYDRFLPDNDRLYRVQRNFDSNGDTLTFQTTSLKLADALRNQVPEIEYVAESDWMGPHGLMAGDKKLYLDGGLTGTDFLKMFRYPLLQGSAGTVFRDAYSIVLTESTAKALFGNDNPMGKTVRFDNLHDLKVTGVLKDLPRQSTVRFNYLVPFSYLEQTHQEVQQRKTGSFAANGYQIFVKLKPGISYEAVYPKIRTIEHTEKDNVNAMSSYITLQPLRNWHLYSNYVNGQDTAGFLVYVRMFSIIGVLVLLIACINFINLTTARSEKRAREVGVRKAVGSRRKDLILQFLTESLVLTLLALVLALIMVWILQNPFNALTGGNVSIPFLSGYFWMMMLGGVLVTAVLAGSRPAFYLSGFQAVKVLKGSVRTGNAASVSRKVLVVLQFSCSIALIISTIVIYRQVQHAKDRPSGYQLNRLMSTNSNTDLDRNFTALKNELLQKGIVQGMTSASSPATNVYWHTDLDHWPGKQAGETVEMGMIITGEDYFKTLGMSIGAGRDFANANDTTSVVFNEAAVKRLGLKDPVGQTIKWNDNTYRVVGVVKDALMLSPFAPPDPTMFAISPRPNDVLLYKLAPGIGTTKAIEQLNTIFSRYSPAFPYEYQFEDENYAGKFRIELLIGKLSGIFAALAIFISCLGLFGLAAYIAELRTKEVGIRKVLGASVLQIWVLLSRDFIVLVLISCLLAAPVAYYFLNGWLQKYQYRVNIGLWIFLVAAMLAVVITVITISAQAMKAAIANPVKALRSE
ncbi:ABC transporter permease [Niabella sp. CC-SYL272]|uniref:ABC transporter permease n=1 Tax=Niabella agricola TaxID=2891571 RepID=UPI001F23B33C|nr:ABC transporter permease [Niabella agricola]MCF3107469.1 ABC transporter permease [Niabella agricola]